MNHRNQRSIIWSNSRQSFLERQILRNINEELGDFDILFYIFSNNCRTFVQIIPRDDCGRTLSDLKGPRQSP